MKILVTGGLGFVGINIVRGLAAQPGVQVIAADVLPWDEPIDRFLAPVQAQVSHHPLDVRDRAAVQELVNDEAISHIVHAAAITATEDEEEARAAEIVAVNLQGSIHVLDAALAVASVARVIVVSSSGVYGTPATGASQAVCETDPLELTNLYAITKQSAELLAARYAVLSGKLMAAVRLPGIYGPMERSHASRRHTSAPGLLMAALRAGQPVTVAGPDVMRDWTYAADVASGLWALLTARQWRHPVYNLSCGQAVPFSAVVKAFVDAGLRAAWINDPSQADIAMRPQQARAPLAIARIQADTAFQPRFPIQAGVAAWRAATG
ncbi:MAG: NAD(P)-dependent oxidoreductase [Caldilineaceae bacterium]|nr:NAD(P)-dependent oxidoreductase [Caldilineaceae bacterium]